MTSPILIVIVFNLSALALAVLWCGCCRSDRAARLSNLAFVAKRKTEWRRIFREAQILASCADELRATIITLESAGLSGRSPSPRPSPAGGGSGGVP